VTYLLFEIDREIGHFNIPGLGDLHFEEPFQEGDEWKLTFDERLEWATGAFNFRGEFETFKETMAMARTLYKGAQI